MIKFLGGKKTVDEENIIAILDIGSLAFNRLENCGGVIKLCSDSEACSIVVTDEDQGTQIYISPVSVKALGSKNF